AESGRTLAKPFSLNEFFRHYPRADSPSLADTASQWLRRTAGENPNFALAASGGWFNRDGEAPLQPRSLWRRILFRGSLAIARLLSPRVPPEPGRQDRSSDR